jgi:hypothetical protein
VDMQDAASVHVALHQPTHNGTSWRVLSGEIAAAIAKMELDGDVKQEGK